MKDLRAPLVPPDCDLRGMEWMPLYGHRLFSSDLWMKVTDAGFRAALRLWWAAWQQSPAASLPNDESALCRLADFGRDMKAFRKVRSDALHGFIECSDGRLYHPLLAEIAMESWARRVKERERKSLWRKKTDENVPRDNKLSPGSVPPPVPDDRIGQDRTGQRRKKEEKHSPDAQGPSELFGSLPKTQLVNGKLLAFKEFWDAYPPRLQGGKLVKPDRARAEREFAKAIVTTPPEKIIEAVKSFPFPRDDPQYIPGPAVWLHAGNYRAEIGPAPTPPGSKPYKKEYFNRPPEEIRKLPEPRPNDIERRSWNAASDGFWTTTLPEGYHLV